jgi:hypothetical protein
LAIRGDEVGVYTVARDWEGRDSEEDGVSEYISSEHGFASFER